MVFKLENPEHQRIAINSVVEVFHGMERNTYDNANKEDIRSNVCSLSSMELRANIKRIMDDNGISDAKRYESDSNDACIEMETGTGKTLTYIQTAYELNKEYGLTKFIVIVPSIPIRQGVIDTFENFKNQLFDKYDIEPHAFVYDSSKLSGLRDFISSENMQVMIMTMASFNTEERILNQTKREDLFNNEPYIKAIAQTHPVIFMDEPQEGMDTDNSKRWLNELEPLFKFRYSATHVVKMNMLYQLTPSESYRLGLVKKIEVLTVAERNDEATLKIEISEVKPQPAGKYPKVKLRYWKFNKTKNCFEFKESGFLKRKDNLADKSGNDSYRDFTIERIYKRLTTQKWVVEFSNNTSIEEGSTSSNKEAIWRLQLEWLIRRHFENQRKLKPIGVKNLSLVFIDRVANYMGPTNPIIKRLFEEEYRHIYPLYHEGRTPTEEQVTAVQGYYFAQTKSGEYTDNKKTNANDKEIYDEILHNKQLLLSFTSPIEFIFSHSALGVGWDNPNVFGIATLNESYSENKKRQEIGRGLRICVNQDGNRVYDAPDVEEDKIINQLTIVPNETYDTFARQYQKENEEAFGNAGPKLKHTHKGQKKDVVKFKMKKDEPFLSVFKRFWNQVAKKTKYRIHLDEDELVRRCIEALNGISISDYEAVVSSYQVHDIDNLSNTIYQGSESYSLRGRFSPQDLLEDLSEKTGLCYNSVMRILTGISNKSDYLRNPPVYMEQAVFKIKQMRLEELVRCIEYTPTGETYPFDFNDFEKEGCDNYVYTPNHGVWDKTLYDSGLERDFAQEADNDNSDIVCFLKFPSWYKIPIPGGYYEPDFGVVLKRKSLKDSNDQHEYYFIIEIKGTNDITDQRALKPYEVARIKFAIKHFQSIGLEAYYKAPVKEYDTFKSQAMQTIKEQKDGNI